MGYKNVIVAFHSCFNRLKAGSFRMRHAGMQQACIVMSLHFGCPFLFFGLKVLLRTKFWDTKIQLIQFLLEKSVVIKSISHMTNNKQISCKIKPKHGYSILLTLFWHTL